MVTVLNKKITKEDLLALCLGCESCKGVWVDRGGTIIVPINNKTYWLRSTGWGVEYSLRFCSDGDYTTSEKSKISTIEKLKEAMRHKLYNYNV